MGKVIFVLVDALGFDAATKHCGFLEHMAESGQGAKYRLIGELPSMSRPMYETLLTGVPVWQHGVTTNEICRHSTQENLFSLTRKAGLVNACAGYDWLLELYGDAPVPFNLMRDRYYLDGSGDIMHGIFYNDDTYPDTHLFADGEFLRRRYNPDFLMIHPMGVDDNGHKFGAASRQYAGAATRSNDMIAWMWPECQKAGYQLVVTGDHGMDNLGMHGGNEPIQRETPLYILSPQVEGGDFSGEEPVSTLDVAPLLCRLLNIEPSKQMRRPAKIRGLKL